MDLYKKSLYLYSYYNSIEDKSCAKKVMIAFNIIYSRYYTTVSEYIYQRICETDKIKMEKNNKNSSVKRRRLRQIRGLGYSKHPTLYIYIYIYVLFIYIYILYNMFYLYIYIFYIRTIYETHQIQSSSKKLKIIPIFRLKINKRGPVYLGHKNTYCRNITLCLFSV